jgi:hypothetical protein
MHGKTTIKNIVLCCNDGVAKNNGSLTTLSVRFCTNTVNALKKINMERTRRTEITLNTTRVIKSKRAQKRTKYQEGLGDP